MKNDPLLGTNGAQDGAMSTWTVGEGSVKSGSNKGEKNGSGGGGDDEEDRDALSVSSGESSTPSW
jgi:hypothetical protein